MARFLGDSYVFLFSFSSRIDRLKMATRQHIRARHFRIVSYLIVSESTPDVWSSLASITGAFFLFRDDFYGNCNCVLSVRPSLDVSPVKTAQHIVIIFFTSRLLAPSLGFFAANIVTAFRRSRLRPRPSQCLWGYWNRYKERKKRKSRHIRRSNRRFTTAQKTRGLTHSKVLREVLGRFLILGKS